MQFQCVTSSSWMVGLHHAIHDEAEDMHAMDCNLG